MNWDFIRENDALSMRDFSEQFGENGFFTQYGDPVVVCGESGRNALCVSAELYERLTGHSLPTGKIEGKASDSL